MFTYYWLQRVVHLPASCSLEVRHRWLRSAIEDLHQLAAVEPALAPAAHCARIFITCQSTISQVREKAHCLIWPTVLLAYKLNLNDTSFKLLFLEYWERSYKYNFCIVILKFVFDQVVTNRSWFDLGQATQPMGPALKAQLDELFAQASILEHRFVGLTPPEVWDATQSFATYVYGDNLIEKNKRS